MQWQPFKQQQQEAGSSTNPRAPRAMAIPTPNPAASTVPPMANPPAGAPIGIVQLPFVPGQSGATSQIVCNIPGCNEAQIDPSANSIMPSTGGKSVDGNSALISANKP